MRKHKKFALLIQHNYLKEKKKDKQVTAKPKNLLVTTAFKLTTRTLDLDFWRFINIFA